MCKVYFIGAGPGDPELLTIKGKKIIDTADIIIYTGSLINEKVLSQRKPDSILYNSAGMTLEEVIKIIVDKKNNKKIIARIHTGDPSIYGAIKEQIDFLKTHNIAFEIIPGVSSFSAAAASLGVEYTLPGVSQTVICTRMEGRTKVPKLEKLSLLASHKTSMVIFLSAGMIEDVVKELLVHYKKETPASVVYKASWKDEKKIIGTLENITDKIKNAGIGQHALILVGDFLDCNYEKSKLYDSTFTHQYRSKLCHGE